MLYNLKSLHKIFNIYIFSYQNIFCFLLFYLKILINILYLRILMKDFIFDRIAFEYALKKVEKIFF